MWFYESCWYCVRDEQWDFQAGGANSLDIIQLFNEHYTYTLPQGDNVTADNNVLGVDNDELDDSDEVVEIEDENMARLNSIT